MDRPDAGEILEVVRTALAERVRPRLEGHAAFEVRVLESLLGIAERELRLDPDTEADVRGRLSRFLDADVPDDAPRARLETELARRIRAGDLDDRRLELLEHLRAITEVRLRIANPRYTERTSR